MEATGPWKSSVSARNADSANDRNADWREQLAATLPEPIRGYFKFADEVFDSCEESEPRPPRLSSGGSRSSRPSDDSSRGSDHSERLGRTDVRAIDDSWINSNRFGRDRSAIQNFQKEQFQEEENSRQLKEKGAQNRVAIKLHMGGCVSRFSQETQTRPSS